jgi:alkyl sulfatase BDS1-like metallo-beta-lactamase superfamily hydrolase
VQDVGQGFVECAVAAVVETVVRDFDLSNISSIEGSKGVIVVDPLLSVECAEAALALNRKHRGSRPVSAVIYSHSHADHFGGVQGASLTAWTSRSSLRPDSWSTPSRRTSTPAPP